MSKQKRTYEAGRIEAERQAAWERARRLRGARSRPAASAASTSSPRARSPRATCTWATSATTRSATPTPASAAPAATPSCSASASTPSGCRPSWRRSSARCPPAEWVVQCGERMLGQMKRLGYSFDYDRVFYSSDEGQYRWSQWLFLHAARDGPDLPRRRHRRLVRHLPDDAGDDPGRGRALLALPQRGAADPSPDLVPADHPLPGGERRQHRALRGARTGTSSRSPPSATSSAAADGVEFDLEAADGPGLTVFTPAPRRGRAGQLRPALAAPPRGRALDRRRGGARGARAAALRRLGAERPRRPARCR